MDQNLNSHISTILSVDNQCTDSGFDIHQFNSLLKKCAEKISLINFNPALRESDFLESPRSIEACRIQGINQRELLIKIQEDVEDEPIPQQFMNHKEEFLDLKLVFYERARQKKLELCLQTRDQLIQMENKVVLKQKTVTNEQCQTPTKSWVTRDGIKFSSPLVSSLEKEKRKVEELKKSHSRYIEYMIDDQIKQQKACIGTYTKLVKISDLKDDRDSDLERRKEDAKQSSFSRELSRIEDSPEKVQARIEKEEKREKSEQKTRAGVERAEIFKGEMGIARETKRKAKEERFENKREDMQRFKAIEFSVKTMMKVERNERKQQAAQEKKEEKARQTELLRQEFQRKVRDMAEYTDLKEKSKKMGYFERSKMYEEKRRKVEEHRQLSTENRKLKAEEKSMTLRQSQERIMAEKQEKKRVQSLKRSKGDMHRENQQDYIILERINKIMRSAEQMDKVKERQQSEEENREAKNQIMLNKMYQSFSKAEEQKKRLLDEGRQRFMIEYLRAEESKDALVRQQQAKEYQKIKFDEKLEEKRAKVDHVTSERKAIIEEKKELRTEFTRQKSLLMFEFEKQRMVMDDELRERTEGNSFERRKLKKSASTYIQRKDLSFSPQHTDSTSYGTRNRIGTPIQGKSHIAMSKLLKDMDANYRNPFKCFESNTDVEREYRSVNPGENDTSLIMGTPQKLTQTMQESGDLSFGGSIKGEYESEPRTKRAKTPVKNVRAKSKEKTSQPGKPRAGQGEESLDLQVQNARKKNMRMFLGLLELEMGNDIQTESAFEATANKIVRYNKGQDEELVALMKKINYMDLKAVM